MKKLLTVRGRVRFIARNEADSLAGTFEAFVRARREEKGGALGTPVFTAAGKRKEGFAQRSVATFPQIALSVYRWSFHRTMIITTTYTREKPLFAETFAVNTRAIAMELVRNGTTAAEIVLLLLYNSL